MSSVNMNKAGMEGAPKEVINKIYKEVTEGSTFTKVEKAKEKEYIDSGLFVKRRIQNATPDEIRSAGKTMQVAVDRVRESLRFDRILVHVGSDMDMFFAAVEEYDDPSLKEKIFAVGSTGMLCTSNYKARKYGIRAGMPGFVGEALAKRLAKDTLILVPPRHGRYKEFSLKAEEVFSQYDPNYAMMSLDEAYMDFTEHLEARLTMTDEQKTFNGVLYDNDIDSAVKEMRQRVFLATGLTCSAGYGANTLVSKIASDMNKPNGQFAVAFDEASVNEFLRPLPLRKIPGIGKRLDLLLKTALDVNTVGDLVDKKHLVPFLFDDEKSSNGFLAGVIAGYGNTFVPQSGPRKSRGKETSIKPTSDTKILLGILRELSDDLGKHCKDAGVFGAGFTLKVKTDQFVLFTRSKVLPRAINDGEEIFKFAEKMFMKEFADGRKYRLLGVALKDFDNKKNNRKITSFFEAPARADERTPKTEQVSWTKTSPEPEIIKRSPLKDRKTKSSFWNKSKNTNPTTVKGENEQEKTTKRNLTAEICEEKFSSSRGINLLDFSDDSNSRGPIYSNKGCPSFWNRNISEEPAADLVEQTGPSRAVEIEYVSDDSRSSTISNASSINSLGPFMKRTTMSKNVPPPLIEEYRKMGAESLQSRLEDIICPEELEEIRNFQNQRPAPKIHQKSKTELPKKSSVKKKAAQAKKSPKNTAPKTSVKNSAISKMFQKAQKRKSDEANLNESKKPHKIN